MTWATGRVWAVKWVDMVPPWWLVVGGSPVAMLPTIPARRWGMSTPTRTAHRTQLSSPQSAPQILHPNRLPTPIHQRPHRRKPRPLLTPEFPAVALHILGVLLPVLGIPPRNPKLPLQLDD